MFFVKYVFISEIRIKNLFRVNCYNVSSCHGNRLHDTENHKSGNIFCFALNFEYFCSQINDINVITNQKKEILCILKRFMPERFWIRVAIPL